MTDKLYSQAELDEQLRLAQAVALRDVLFILENKLEGVFTGNETEEPEVHFLERDFDDAVEKIRALISPAASLALDRLIAKARLEEAEWWFQMHTHMFPHPEGSLPCRICLHMAELRRAVEGATNVALDPPAEDQVCGTCRGKKTVRAYGKNFDGTDEEIDIPCRDCHGTGKAAAQKGDTIER